MTESTLTRSAVEDALREAVPHSCLEWINTGGGVMNLLVHTELGEDPTDTDHGPVVGIGPFTPDGEAEWRDACSYCAGDGCQSCAWTGGTDLLMAWDETAYLAGDESGVEGEPDLATTDAVVVRVLDLAGLGWRKAVGADRAEEQGLAPILDAVTAKGYPIRPVMIGGGVMAAEVLSVDGSERLLLNGTEYDDRPDSDLLMVGRYPVDPGEDEDDEGLMIDPLATVDEAVAIVAEFRAEGATREAEEARAEADRREALTVDPEDLRTGHDRRDGSLLKARHLLPGEGEIGLPYARAGFTLTETGGWATATCPVCGHVAMGYDATVAHRAYALHYEQAARAEARAVEVAAGDASPITVALTDLLPGDVVVEVHRGTSSSAPSATVLRARS